MRGKKLDETTALKIKDAAREVFLAKGYDGATMQMIADRSGVNKALLHYYYRSKDNLFLLIFMEEMQGFMKSLEPMLRSQDIPLKEKLDRWIDAEARFVGQFPELPLFLITEFHRNPEMIQEFSRNVGVQNVASQMLSIDAQQQQIRPGTTIVDLLMMVMSLIVFPVLSAPLFMFMTGESADRWEAMRAQQISFAKKLLDEYLV